MEQVEESPFVVAVEWRLVASPSAQRLEALLAALQQADPECCLQLLSDDARLVHATLASFATLPIHAAVESVQTLLAASRNHGLDVACLIGTQVYGDSATWNFLPDDLYPSG